MTVLTVAIDWASKGLTLVCLLLAVLFVVWQCADGLAKTTVMGRAFLHYCRNKHNFERWLREMDAREAKEASE